MYTYIVKHVLRVAGETDDPVGVYEHGGPDVGDRRACIYYYSNRNN